MKAAIEGRRGSKLRILAVTVLTSYDDADLAAAGYEMDVKELASARAAQARDIGIDGLVCSAEEVTALRDIAGAGMVLADTRYPARRRRMPATRSGSSRRPEAIKAGADFLWWVGQWWRRRSEIGRRCDCRGNRCIEF